MSDSLRVNLYLSSSRERELFQHIQGVSPEERTSTFKYLAFLGLMVSKNPAGLQKAPMTKNTRNESRREKPLDEPTITDTPKAPVAQNHSFHSAELTELDASDFGLSL